MREPFKDNEPLSITADMTILDVVSRYRQTEAVFKEYDKKADACLCCQALFDPLKEVAKKYGLNLERLAADLEMIAREAERSKEVFFAQTLSLCNVQPSSPAPDSDGYTGAGALHIHPRPPARFPV